jgi:4-amino-4-deoxy-L-arabinose transferase-like glycosyltransferase
VAFFSFSGSKLPGYVLPAVPGAALVMADDFEALWSQRAKQSQWIALALTGGFMICGGVALPFLKKINIDLSMRLILAPVLFSSGLAICAGALKRLRLAVVATIAMMVILIPMVSIAILPQLTERESIKPLALIAKQARQPNEPIVYSGDLPRVVHGFTFYTDSRITYDEDTHGLTLDQVIEEARQTGSLLCVTTEQGSSALAANSNLTADIIGRQRNILLIRVARKKQQ